MTSSEKKTVALWKRRLLPGTETFIRNQQDAYSRYAAVAIGSQRQNSPLARESDMLLYENGGILGKFKAKILSACGYSRELSSLLENESIDIVHAHFAPEGFSISRACKKLGIPLVVSFHGHDINEAPYMPGWRGKRYRRRLKKLFKEADAFIAISEALRERAVKLGCPPEKIQVKYTGIPTTGTENTGSESVEKYWDVIFVGRFIDIKGPLHVIQAASKAQEALGKPVKVAMIGSGPLLEEAQTLAAQLDVSVEFMGHQRPSEVERELQRSRVFCAPSMSIKPNQLEGFGMVYLEAALASIPVNAYAYGGVQEAVAHEESGLLAREGDVEELARNLTRLLADPDEAQRMGLAGKKRAIELFSMTRCIAEIELLYDEVLAR